MTHTRPRSIFALLVQLAWLRRRVVAPALAGVVVLALAGTHTCPGPEVPTRVATFNIRFFPENERQIDGAFEIIRELDVPIVAVQEITDPGKFASEAADRLGGNWRVEFGPWRQEKRILLPGVLYDSRRYQLDGARVHAKTAVGGGRAMLEVRLFSREDGTNLRVFVVHLKSGDERKDHEARFAQLDAMTPILRRAVASGDEVVILGDFNTIGPVDRAAMRTFAEATALHWASEPLECTAYYVPGKTKPCTGSALDHVFTSEPAQDIAARGPCESIGCAPGEQCPIFHAEVSDHCPVTATF